MLSINLICCFRLGLNWFLALQVILAELKKTHEFYAIKVLTKISVLEDNDVEATLVERRLLELGSQCPFIASLFCAFQSSVCPAIHCLWSYWFSRCFPNMASLDLKSGFLK